MITGSTPLKIEGVLFIDHCAEGVGMERPLAGETMVGFPYGYFTEQSLPFVEVRMNGKLTRTINVLDLTLIDFEVEK